MHAYKIQFVQQLKPADHQKRRQFCEWIEERLAVDENFAKNIIFSDEAHFHLSGFVNKQNCRIWGNENPRVTHEHQMHPERTTVWCGFWAGGVIGPFFFEDDEGVTVTINGERYRHMLTNFLWPFLQNIDMQNLWFQQDGATCHNSRETIEIVKEKFPGRLISLRGDQEWSARSCDLTPVISFCGVMSNLKFSLTNSVPFNN